MLARALVRHDPERMVWAGNWPHPLAGPGAMPDNAMLLDLLLDWVPDEATRNRILEDNPAKPYEFPAPPKLRIRRSWRGTRDFVFAAKEPGEVRPIEAR